MRRKNAGFTLIEIAIVLIIIGLLIGGVLKGQEMITQARIKNTINDLNGISIAVHTYQERYRRMPGDDDKASTRWNVNNVAVNNGNGDGLIAAASGALEAFNSTVADVETRLFWQHLRLSGLITGDGADQSQPQNAFAGVMGVQQGGLGMTGLVLCTANLPPKVAAAIDTQLDDGDPVRGQIRSMIQDETIANVPTAAQQAEGIYDESRSTSTTLCRALF